MSLKDQYSLSNPFASAHLLEKWSRYYLLLLLIYPLIVKYLRRHRLRSSLKSFPYANRKSFSTMTNDDAFRIQKDLVELEFPFTYEKALQFALFRTYGIPTVSRLLVGTSELSSADTAPKRYVDTVILIQEFMGHAPTSKRTLEAVSRMNYLHSGYQKSRQILDDDLLYTLSLFAREPAWWINKYEWRQLEDFERCAIGTYWKSMGDAMGIGYEKLKSGKDGWIDGLHWLEEVTEWSNEYESRSMRPHINNKKTAEQTVAILLWNIPPAMKGIGRHVVSALMDDRLRTAMMYPNPPEFYFPLVSILFGIRKLFLRHLALPRPSFLRVSPLSDTPTEQGSYFTNKYEAAPFYVQPTVWSRWQPTAWMSWCLGLPLPGDDGDRYFPKGYRIAEVGPTRMRGTGAEYARESMDRLQRTR
ncbi:hypothetical protein MMC07_004646, partial [Pseudocyphellaria aurata]|nr:hypothetical protein [Pseudocyphellaria aurata]